MFAILGNYASGDAQNITISPNLTNDPIPSLPLRPNFVGRNTVRTSNIFQTDLRYTRSFSIGDDVRIEGVEHDDQYGDFAQKLAQHSRDGLAFILFVGHSDE